MPKQADEATFGGFTLKELEALCEKATMGPWSKPCFIDGTKTCQCRWICAPNCAGSVAEISIDNKKRIGEGGNDSPPLEEAKANALFIIACRSALPDLLAEIRRLSI